MLSAFVFDTGISSTIPLEGMGLVLLSGNQTNILASWLVIDLKSNAIFSKAQDVALIIVVPDECDFGLRLYVFCCIRAGLTLLYFDTSPQMNNSPLHLPI